MNRFWETFWLLCVAVLLVTVTGWITPLQPIPDEQAQEASVSGQKPVPVILDRSKTEKAARLVPVYPVGSLPVLRKKALPPVKEEQNPVAEKAMPEKTGSVDQRPRPPVNKVDKSGIPSLKLSGERPVLDVSYETIGFDRYLEIIEKVGRFFLLIDKGGNIAVGPEISLLRGAVMPGVRGDMSGLAVKRPNLVRDSQVSRRLEIMGLPPDAIEDRVILLLRKPFDRLLWNAVRSGLSSKGLALKDIARIEGAYEEIDDNVFLKLEVAVARDGRREVPLEKRIKVSL